MELQKDGSLIVSDFSKGIGQSILSDYSDMMGVNIDINPGLASANVKSYNGLAIASVKSINGLI